MTQTPHRTDHELKAAIIEDLDWTPRVNEDRIGVSVTDRGITLSGEVRSHP
jgi:osmotically-inducible protein OsmY